MADISIIGAGLVGSLLALTLAQKGYKIKVYEKRNDPRISTTNQGKSINLAISTRGIEALKTVNLDKYILDKAIAMYTRAIHDIKGNITHQSYGINNNYFINSISRRQLNIDLLNECSKNNNIEFFFNHDSTSIDFANNSIIFKKNHNSTVQLSYDLLLACDGANSITREAIRQDKNFVQSVEKLDYGYKEFTIEPATNGDFKLVKNSLHIWPRGNFMFIALPNLDGSFTATLFLPYEGELSFKSINTYEKAKVFFNTYFGDLQEILIEPEKQLLENTLGHMVTVKCNPWFTHDNTLLLGDAAHGIIPFYGQGMNCGFEDVTVFNKILDSFDSNILFGSNRQEIFSQYYASRKINCDAISDMAYENFIEMRDKVADNNFLDLKKIENILEKEFKGQYFSRYSLVSFSNLPYKFALELGQINLDVLKELQSNKINDSINFNRAQELIDLKIKPLLKPYNELLQNLIKDRPYG